MAGSTVKMGVDVTQFKQGMKEAENSVKTLDAALKYNEKQMKASGNAEKDYTAQANLLNAKLKEQKNIVKNAQNALKEMEKNGVRTTSAAYQDMQRKLINAQSAILDTEAAINSLGTAEQNAAQSADQLGESVASIGKKMSLQQVQQGLKSIDNFLTGMAQTALNIGKNLVSGITESASWADDLLTTSITTGIDVETLQKMEIAGKIFDTSVDTIVNARRKLNRGMQSGTASTMNALEELGLVMTEAGGKTAEVYKKLWSTDSQKMFWEAGSRLMGLDNDDDRDRLAQDIFGKSFADLLPLFTAGEDAYNDFIDKQNAMSEEKVKTLGELNDQWEQMQYQFDLTKNELMVSLAPALETVSGVITDLLKAFNDYLETDEGKAKMEALSQSVQDLFSGIKDIKPGDVMDTAKGIIDGIVNSLKWIAQNKDKVVDGIKAIGIAWGTIKITSGLTTIMNFVSGIKGFSAGSAAAAGTAAGSGWGASFAAAALSALKAVPWVAAAMALIYPLGEEIKQAGGLEVFGEGVLDTAKDTFDPTKWPDKFNRAAKSNMTVTDLISSIFGGNGTLVEPEQKTGAEQERDTINTRILTEMMKNPEYNRAVADMMRGNADAYNKIRDSIVQQFIEAGTLTRDSEGNLHEPGFKKRVYVNGHGSLSVTEWDEYQENLKKLEEQGVTVPANLKLEDAANWAADAVKQIGVVQIPAQFTYWGMQTGAGGAGDPNAYYTLGLDQASHPHANGLFSVPWDGYPAILHKGERVVPAAQANNYNSNIYFGNVNLNNGLEIEALTESIDRRNRRQRNGYGAN